MMQVGARVALIKRAAALRPDMLAVVAGGYFVAVEQDRVGRAVIGVCLRPVGRQAGVADRFGHGICHQRPELGDHGAVDRIQTTGATAGQSRHIFICILAGVVGLRLCTQGGTDRVTCAGICHEGSCGGKSRKAQAGEYRNQHDEYHKRRETALCDGFHSFISNSFSFLSLSCEEAVFNSTILFQKVQH